MPYVVRALSAIGLELARSNQEWAELTGAVAAARGLADLGLYKRIVVLHFEDESEVLVIVWDSRRND